ncbi:MAG: phosphoribosyltransferase family protein [bacterium]|jgi:pyrimidine operon attenuation protein/uracil phosphoribosyltransferase|nr:phosphoribosyltransferase [Chitinophagaceae bacterium]
MGKKYILTPEKAMMSLRRMAFEILERNNGATAVSIAGIRENGYVVAQELKTILAEISTLQIDLIEILIDKSNPIDCSIPDSIDLKDKILIVVDDVVNSGKTLLYAILPFLQFSPKQIQTLTLVERSYKIFPVHVDYVGISLATTLQENISVEVVEAKLAGAYVV